jgi:hypothetical protein
MERHIALMGPPGVGKSTIIRAMADRSMRVLDFEALWHLPRPSNLRILNEMGSSSSRFIIGAAGFVPLEILQASFEPWLLYLPPTSYVGRRKRRDQRDPDKAGQKEYDISQWLWIGIAILFSMLGLLFLNWFPICVDTIVARSSHQTRSSLRVPSLI